uniref:Vitellogenin domain-containing protein n=1 Tax=Dicentrarchus labrax TaxID=13489 RepID=A0A8P4GDW4_DICLA
MFSEYQTIQLKYLNVYRVLILAKRFKNFRRFVYDYEAETLNSVTGAMDNKSGPKVSCKVEVDVPQTCSFILRTTECSLSEISGVDAEGNQVYRPADGAEAFKAAMAKNPLKITVEEEIHVRLYPEDDEPVNILNVKRGIVSALVVPVMEEESNKYMSTVHGICPTDFTVNAREDIATDVTVSRDLSKCSSFFARRQDTSPLALITGMNYPLSKMISSAQSCNYKFDNQKKHMTRGICTEQHTFLPLSHQNEYSILTMVKQTVTLRETAKINDRVFDRNEDNRKFLSMDVADNKSPVQTKDAAIATMQQLNTLSQTTQGEERASLFHKLVSELRGLKVDVLGSATVEMMDMSQSLTWQALAQCGTPECTSAMMKVLRTFDEGAVEVDAAVYALGLLPNPSRLMVKDMLAMAQYRQSKPIMYALSNAVRKRHPEITAVSEFMASLLGADCAGEKDLTFLILRVVGNMGDAMEAADPAIKNTLLKCMRQPATTLSVQLAAIQAFRRMSVTDEVRSNLQRVSQYPKGAVQKRLAAYLILMRDPKDSDIEIVKKLLNQEQNTQIKSFVSSHVYNIISSTDSETQKLGKKIMDALQDTDVTTHNDFTTKSRNYKLGVAHEDMQASIQGNIVFDPSSQLPKEALLETTLKAFGFNMNIWEVGMEGRGFEPTIDALFGKNGFFPDTVAKTLYWAVDKIPELDRLVATESEGRKVPENLVREIVRNFNKLVKDLQSQESPEATAYLRIMGTELGYIKGNELKSIAYNAMMYADIFMRIIPTKVMAELMSSTNNEIFAHYIFMDNKFIIPTASGLPLTFALSGTFTSGAKGGLRLAPNMKELLFMPSVGVEFVTQMGVNVPEFVESTVEMHTNMYHESVLNAKISMEESQVKLSIPAPQGTTKLFMLIVGAGQAAMIPHTEGESSCRPLFSGVRYCTKTLRANARDNAAVPYFPVKFSVDIKPSKEVSEYTATIAYKLLSEGKDGRHKVDSLKFALKAEGAQPTEATAMMKYNRNRNVFTTQIEIPDFDVEAGVKIGLTDSSARGKTITLEITNKNVPQLSLIGRAKLQAMTDGMLQVQLLVPSLKTDATVTATMSKVDGLTMEIKSDVKLPETSSIQAVTFKYGEEQAEVQLMSNMNADTKILVPYTEALQAWLRQFVEDAMDQQVVKTDMKLGTWLCSSFSRLNESTFRYQFNQDRLTISIPLPLGGKSSEELRIPAVVSTPSISMPQLDMEFPSKEIQIPTFTIPSEYDLTLPLMGMAEVSAKVNSNYYNWEATASAGNNTAESPSYLAKFNIQADSPIKFLSFSTEGATKIIDTAEKTMKFTIDGSLNHMLLDTSFNVLETIAVTDNVMSTGKYSVHAVAPLGLETSLTVTTQVVLDSNILSGDINTDGSVSVGPMTASTTYLHTFSVEPAKKEARLESTLRVNSEILKVANKIKASYANEELLIESNTNMNSDPIKHTTKISLSYKDVKLTVQSDSVTKADDRMLRSQIEFSASEGQASLRIENQADDTENRAYSLLTGSMNPSGLEINADASLNIFSSLASHKATLALNMNGLTTSCTTTAHTEVYLNGVLKGNLFDINTRNRTDNVLDNRNSYMHDITVNMERFIASVNVKNDLKIMEINFVNDAQFKAEPYNMELTGTMMGVFSEEELKHTYEVKFVDMVLSAKCNTNGKLLGTHTTHTTDMEIAGLNVKFNNVANFNSPSLRLDSTVKTVAAPFTLNIDAIFNSDGAVYLYGQQSGELYSKFLLKAEPLLFTHSFESRASTTHELEGRPTIKTNMENKFNSMLSLQEQSVSLKMTSKVNEHTFDQEISAYNNAERMGIEMMGAASTPLLSDASNDYAISGFVKYDKNSDSHFIQIPFIEHLPAVIENVKATVMRLVDNSIEMLKDINTKYEISATFQNKVSELKEVIDNFDFNLFVQDLRKFINSMENFVTNLIAKFPTDKVMNELKSMKDTIMAWIKKYNIANKFNVIIAKVEEILSSYEVENMIGAIMDEVVKIMKQYQVREKIQSAFAALRSIDIQPLLKRLVVPVQELVNELYSFDFKQLIEDMSNYFMRMVQKITSFDYDTFTMELKEKVAEMSKIPCFGKLYGEFRVTSPHYTLRTTADLENTTTTSVTPDSALALITPSELMFDTKNKGNAKVALPFDLSGKMDLQNDISFTLNSEAQQASWTGLARFNQYKYSHYFTLDNGDSEINIFSQINGEANLDVLKGPITIPQITVPFVGLKTPRVEDFSLWEDTGLSYFLITTQQTFDMNSKLNIELPKTITVPAYKVPVMNVEVSTFTIPLPDFSLITMPALHVPSALSKLTFPKITLPKIPSIKIPVMGDLTYDFSMKTAMITLKTDASILNQDSIIIRLNSSSISECEFLNGKIEGNTNVNTVNGFKMASVLSAKHSVLEGNHDSTIFLSYDNVDTSITNSAKVNLPYLTMEINQEITGNPDEGLVVSMSTPSAGHIALQMQTKRPAQVKARVYGHIEILGLKMSVMNSEKLNLQTTWNVEMPYEMMLRLKKQVPTVMEIVSEPATRTYNTIYRHARSLEGSFEQVRNQGKVMFRKAIDNLAAVKSSNVITTVTDKTILILKEYQKKVEIVFDAVVKFLRETKFQIPGYEQRLSGLQVYQKCSAFVADVSEEAVQKIPQYFTSMFKAVLDYINTIEFTLPGSNHVVRGREILDDLFVALRKIQNQVIVTVKSLGDIQLEDIINKLSAIMQFTIEQSEKFLQTIKSQNSERLYTFVTDVYNDAMNSRALSVVVEQVEEAQRIVIEYLKAVRAKLQTILADMSSAQLQADIQSWIDVLVKRVNAFHNNVIKTLKEKSKNVEPFVKVGDRQMEVNIPLPFVAKSN